MKILFREVLSRSTEIRGKQAWKIVTAFRLEEGKGVLEPGES